MSENETTLFPDLPTTAVTADPVRESAFDGWWPEGGAWITGGQYSQDVAHEAFCAGWESAAPAIRAQALRELAADLKATGERPDFRNVKKGLNLAAAIAEDTAGKA